MEDICDIKVIHYDRLKIAKEKALSSEDAETLASFFKTLGDPGRLKIISALAVQELCVCDIAALLNSSQSAVSHQLRLLRSLNIVKNRRDGTVLFYTLVSNQVADIVKTVEQEII